MLHEQVHHENAVIGLRYNKEVSYVLYVLFSLAVHVGVGEVVTSTDVE